VLKEKKERRNSHYVLSDEQVREIRKSLPSLTDLALAKKYNVHKKTIEQIRKGLTYTFVD